MKLKYRSAVRIVLIVLIVLTIGFIFGQSMLPPEESSAESDAVGEFVGEIIPPETKPGEFVQVNIRKIAHFFEFALFGLELSLYAVIFLREKSFILKTYAFSLFVALVDETIQIFSGRGPSVFDVWLDFFGFSTFASLVYITAFAIIFFRKSKVK